MSERDGDTVMAAGSEQPGSSPAEQGWQWAFSYLRQDLQDVRAEMRESLAEVRAEMRESLAEVRAEIRELRAEMTRRMDRQFTITITTILAIGGLLAGLIKL